MGAMTEAAFMAGFAMRAAMAAIFVFAVLHALRDRAAFEGIVLAYRILPEPLARLAASLLPPLEATLAVALVLPWTSKPASLAALSLLAGFTAAIVLNLVRGRRDIACGCGGGDGQKLAWGLALRNLLLFTGLAASLTAPVQLPVAPAALIGIAGFSAFLGALYLAANQLMANAQAWPRQVARS